MAKCQEEKTDCNARVPLFQVSILRIQPFSATSLPSLDHKILSTLRAGWAANIMVALWQICPLAQFKSVYVFRIRMQVQ
jgi:hypothetical protein